MTLTVSNVKIPMKPPPLNSCAPCQMASLPKRSEIVIATMRASPRTLACKLCLAGPGHEAQWRGSYAPQGSRSDDITKLYTTTRWEEAQSIIDQYDIRYIYIGALERTSMPVKEEKFQTHLKPIFQQGDVVIYEVP